MRQKIWKLQDSFSTTQIIAMGFLIVILSGAILLSLPISSTYGEATNFIDALFTSTTSVCVTGLVTLPTATYWSVFGKIVILCLIQVGGLGFMTFFTTVLLLLKKRVTLKERMTIQDSLNETGLSGLVKLVKKIIKGTLIVEGIGALLYSINLIPVYGPVKGIWVSVFTAVSAFCNAGIDIFGADGMEPFFHFKILNFTTMMLIFLGGIGFSVWWDAIKVFKHMRINKTGLRKSLNLLSLHSKLSLTITGILILGGALGFLLFEYNNPNTLKGNSLFDKIMASLFQSITTRTAGFATIAQSDMTISSQLLTVCLMVIGGSTAGTAGGIKTATFGAVVLSVIAVIRGKECTQAFNRTIPAAIVRKALAIMCISLMALIAGCMVLSLTEHADSFMVILFEVTSALATVGLSLGITAELNILSKILIIILMYIGRIGPISMAIAFTIKRRKAGNGVKLPDENIMVG